MSSYDDDTMIQGRVGDEIKKRFDDWRRRQAEIPNISDALRVLLARGLDAERVPNSK
jgi:hypothetical protein